MSKHPFNGKFLIEDTVYGEHPLRLVRPSCMNCKHSEHVAKHVCKCNHKRMRKELINRRGGWSNITSVTFIVLADFVCDLFCDIRDAKDISYVIKKKYQKYYRYVGK